jgi:hypothetical protein
VILLPFTSTRQELVSPLRRTNSLKNGPVLTRCRSSCTSFKPEVGTEAKPLQFGIFGSAAQTDREPAASTMVNAMMRGRTVPRTLRAIGPVCLPSQGIS